MKPEWIRLTQFLCVMNTPTGVVLQSMSYIRGSSVALAMVFVPNVQIDKDGNFVKLDLDAIEPPATLG